MHSTVPTRTNCTVQFIVAWVCNRVPARCSALMLLCLGGCLHLGVSHNTVLFCFLRPAAVAGPKPKCCPKARHNFILSLLATLSSSYSIPAFPEIKGAIGSPQQVLMDITGAANALVHLWRAFGKKGTGSGTAAEGGNKGAGARGRSKGSKGPSEDNSTVQYSTDPSVLRYQEAIVMGVIGSAVQLFGVLKAEVGGPDDVAGGGGGADVAGEDGENGTVETSPVDAAESALHQCLEMVLNSTGNNSTAAVSGYTTVYPTVFPRAPTPRELKLLHGHIEAIMV